MQFVYQPLTWGFFLVLVPLLIHLINILRHRRVKWAAMDFLLQSYKKHRKWIWLKQLLLLLMRMAAIAIVVAMLAQWVTRGQWLEMFGGKPTHHYVLLDDSYSMSDRLGGVSAFESGLAAVQRIGAQAAAAVQSGPQKFTLIRFSRAAREAGEEDSDRGVGPVADFNAEIVDPNFDVSLAEKNRTFQVTELAVGPGPALAVLRRLIDEAASETRMVYVVSDFRTAQWDNPAELRETLRSIEQTPAKVNLVGCVRETHPNVAVVDAAPANETRAAGVPLFVNVRVKNFGPEAARNVQVKVRSVFYDPELQASAAPDQVRGKSDELPTILIDEIPTGQTATRHAQVFFPKPGKHVLEASLLDDPVGVDNHRWCVIEFPEAEPILLVDGSTEQRHAYYLQSAFQPGGRANTGIRCEVKQAAFLRDAPLDVLRPYRAIYLLDVPRLDERAIATLEEYVRGGGGLGVFVGPDVELAFYNNQLYKGGNGLLPLLLGREDFLPPEDAENTPDIEPAEHPVFSVFLGERNPFIRLITIDRFLRPQDEWKPAPDSGVQVAASLRNQEPLAVERKFGQGRVMIFLTTAAPDWNNWANDPSFVVMALKLQSHLASSQRPLESRPVGSELSVAVEAQKYRPDMSFVAPGETPETRVVIERVGTKPAANSALIAAAIGKNGTGGVGETDRSGVYEAWPVTLAGERDVRRFALNVEPAEGDLAMLAGKPLLDKLEPVKADFRYADEYNYETAGLSGENQSLLLMGLLVALLLLEQVLAYSASYHPARVMAGSV
jgi:hypothetical protein